MAFKSSNRKANAKASRSNKHRSGTKPSDLKRMRDDVLSIYEDTKDYREYSNNDDIDRDAWKTAPSKSGKKKNDNKITKSDKFDAKLYGAMGKKFATKHTPEEKAKFFKDKRLYKPVRDFVRIYHLKAFAESVKFQKNKCWNELIRISKTGELTFSDWQRMCTQFWQWYGSVKKLNGRQRASKTAKNRKKKLAARERKLKNRVTTETWGDSYYSDAKVDLSHDNPNTGTPEVLRASIQRDFELWKSGNSDPVVPQMQAATQLATDVLFDQIRDIANFIGERPSSIIKSVNRNRTIKKGKKVYDKGSKILTGNFNFSEDGLELLKDTDDLLSDLGMPKIFDDVIQPQMWGNGYVSNAASYLEARFAAIESALSSTVTTSIKKGIVDGVDYAKEQLDSYLSKATNIYEKTKTLAGDIWQKLKHIIIVVITATMCIMALFVLPEKSALATLATGALGATACVSVGWLISWAEKTRMQASVDDILPTVEKISFIQTMFNSVRMFISPMTRKEWADNKWEIDRLCSLTRVTRTFDSIFNFIEKVVTLVMSYLYEHFTGVPWLNQSQKVIRKQQVEQMTTALELERDLLAKELKWNDDMMTRANILYNKMNETATNVESYELPPSSQVAWLRVYAQVKAWVSSFRFVTTTAAHRVEPTNIVFTGEAGTGKTFGMNLFHRMIVKGISEKDDPGDYVYAWPLDQFWDGYTHKHFITCAEEALQNRDVKVRSDFIENFIKMDSTINMPLKMAAVESKNVTFFNSKVLTMTTNFETMNHTELLKYCQSPQAFIRRMDFICHFSKELNDFEEGEVTTNPKFELYYGARLPEQNEKPNTKVGLICRPEDIKVVTLDKLCELVWTNIYNKRVILDKLDKLQEGIIGYNDNFQKNIIDKALGRTNFETEDAYLPINLQMDRDTEDSESDEIVQFDDAVDHSSSDEEEYENGIIQEMLNADADFGLVGDDEESQAIFKKNRFLVYRDYLVEKTKEDPKFPFLKLINSTIRREVRAAYAANTELPYGVAFLLSRDPWIEVNYDASAWRHHIVSINKAMVEALQRDFPEVRLINVLLFNLRFDPEYSHQDLHAHLTDAGLHGKQTVAMWVYIDNIKEEMMNHCTLLTSMFGIALAGLGMFLYKKRKTVLQAYTGTFAGKTKKKQKPPTFQVNRSMPLHTQPQQPQNVVPQSMDTPLEPLISNNLVKFTNPKGQHTRAFMLNSRMGLITKHIMYDCKNGSVTISRLTQSNDFSVSADHTEFTICDPSEYSSVKRGISVWTVPNYDFAWFILSTDYAKIRKVPYSYFVSSAHFNTVVNSSSHVRFDGIKSTHFVHTKYQDKKPVSYAPHLLNTAYIDCYVPGAPGVCSSIYCTTSPQYAYRIWGIHHSGNNSNRSVASPLTKELVEDLYKFFEEITGIKPQATISDEFISEMPRPMKRCSKVQFQNSRTAFVPTVFQEVAKQEGKPVKTRPALLKDTPTRKVAEISLARKINFEAFPPDAAIPKEIDQAVDFIKLKLKAHSLLSHATLSEAINGNEYMPAITLSTGSGHGFLPKSNYFIRDPETNLLEFTPKAYREFCEVFEYASQNQAHPKYDAVIQDCFKDETLPLAKVHEGRTRIMGPMGLYYMILERLVFMSLITAILRYRVVGGPIDVGINYGVDWQRLIMEKLLNLDPETVAAAGDFRAMDAHFIKQMLDRISEIAIYVLPEHHEDFATIIRWLNNTFGAHSRHLFFDVEYETSCNASGRPMTTYNNSILVWMIILATTIRKVNQSEEELSYDYLDHISQHTCIFGDDHVVALPRENPPFDMFDLAQMSTEVGQVYTSIYKDQDLVPYFEWDEVVYLQRHLRPALDDFACAPLQKDILEQMMYWAKDTQPSPLREIDLYQSHMYECVHWGRDYFNSRKEYLNDIFFREFPGVNLPFIDYDKVRASLYELERSEIFPLV